MATAWSRASRKQRFDWSTACYVTSVKRWWSDWSKRTRMSVPTIHTFRFSLFLLFLSLSLLLSFYFSFFLFSFYFSLSSPLSRPFLTGFPTSITLIHSPKRRYSSRQSFFYWEKCASSSLPIPADKDTRQIGFTTATISDSFILLPLRSRINEIRPCDPFRWISFRGNYRPIESYELIYIKNLLETRVGKNGYVKNREKSSHIDNRFEGSDRFSRSGISSGIGFSSFPSRILW